jgi:hypothetical protein
MTDPGSMGQQAAQQAAASAGRAAHQGSARAHDMTVRGAGRPVHVHRSRTRSGFFGRVVFTVMLAIVVLLVLNTLQPDVYASVTTWVESLF